MIPRRGAGRTGPSRRRASRAPRRGPPGAPRSSSRRRRSTPRIFPPARGPSRTASRCCRPARRSARPVVAFTGRLMYRPNRLAVRRLLRDIWPRVRRAVPDARLLLGGADAPGEIRASEGREGVEVVSPVADMAAFLRRARVVVAPVDLGSGHSEQALRGLRGRGGGRRLGRRHRARRVVRRKGSRARRRHGRGVRPGDRGLSHGS